jgi:hypothetical protein
LFVPLVVTAGCLDYEAGIAFNKDMTGKASFKMTMDLGPFVTGMIQTMGARAGGPPPDDMMPMIKQQLADQMGNGMIDVAQLKAKLPEGVTLVDSAQKFDELKLVMSFGFAFTDATKLPSISTAHDPAHRTDGGCGRSGHEAVREPSIRRRWQDADDHHEAEARRNAQCRRGQTKVDAAAAAQRSRKQSAAGTTRYGRSAQECQHASRSASTCLTVVEHNAPKKDGQSYIWEMKLDSMGLDGFPDKMPEPPKINLKIKK